MKTLKKVELHLHLEGAAPPAFVRDLAAAKHTDISGVFDSDGHYKYRSFDEFLRVYEVATSVITTPGDYARLLEVVLSECAEQGAIYAELFVSPEFCGGGDVGAWREYLAAMSEVAARMDNTIASRGIATIIRHFGAERAKKTALCAAETGGDWLTGFGMGGAEAVGKATDFMWSYSCAAEAGLGLTCHAGEWGGPDSIRDAMALGATRIGHGVRAVEDPQLLRDLAEERILLEVCPGSNVALGLFTDWRAHPIARIVDSGVRVCVSTDDPPFFHTSLSQEYARLHDALGWSEEEFATMNGWAVDGAFCDTVLKDRLRKALA